MKDVAGTRLGSILESTRRRIETLSDPAEPFEAGGHAARRFAEALSVRGLSVIAEVKRRSPSRGDLATDLDPVAQALHYERGGAAAVSVLTEPDHFSGTTDDLRHVREAIGLPVLRKDFVLDERQVWESRTIGADALLLIVAALDEVELTHLLDVTHEAGLDALVEVHDASEAEIALAAGAQMIGVNNRDLRSFEVDLTTAERLAPLLDGVAVTVAESGIATQEDAERMADAGYDAILVGETLVRSPDPESALRSLVG